jgi:uncharacterized protein YodC (DUF2158 family)
MSISRFYEPGIFTKKSMEIQFVAGDKVRLTSGGPEMTIRGMYYDSLTNEYRKNMLDCIWFAKNQDGKNQLHYQPFMENELIKMKYTY